jgi:hypothetical protein
MRGGFAPCEGAWCGPCYIPLGIRDFPVRQKLDDDGEILEEADEATRFNVARAGDHMMVPFQCDLCHFRNIMMRDPEAETRTDWEILDMIRRANLDAFWSREKSSVGASLREAVRMEKMTKRLGMPCITPPMGPWPLEDVLGMKVALAVLDRSLDKGVYEATVQWDTFRRQMSGVTNISQAGVGGLGNSVGAYERNRMFISESVTHKFWFSRFMAGVHKRVGQVRKPDRVLTIDIIHAVDRILETEWENAERSDERKRIAEMGTWFLGGFCTGLRGEEMLLIELAGTANSLVHLGDPKDAHFVFVISGRTKGDQVSGAKFGVPCVPVTKGTHLRPGRWVKRLVTAIHGQGRRNGRLFNRRLKVAKLEEFENDFFTVLEKVQATSNLFPEGIDIRDECGIARTIRRTVTAHARNMGIHRDVLNANNRWRAEFGSKTGNPRLDMADVYTTLESLLPTLLQFSLWL